MIYKIGLLGASGKMGLEIAGLLAAGLPMGRDYFELAEVVSKSGKLRSIEGLEVRSLDDVPREPVHVWIDFSRPEATLQLLTQIEATIVIGTTGFTDAQMETLRSYSYRHPVLIAPNTSPGMNLMMALLRALPSNLPWATQILLREEHHIRKVDSPSGTARHLAGILKSQGFDNIALQVTRAGGIKGNHSIRFIGEHEEVEISHHVMDRKAFAQGALQAAQYLVQQDKPGIYTMEDAILGVKKI